MRYIVCLLINVIIAVIIAVDFDWAAVFSVLLFALMAEYAVLCEMKYHDNRKFWEDYFNHTKR